MNGQEIVVEWSRRICTITLNRPDRMNALNRQTLDALAATVAKLQFDRSNRVVITTGTGHRAFCSGADLEERVTFTHDQVRRFVRPLGGSGRVR